VTGSGVADQVFEQVLRRAASERVRFGPQMVVGIDYPAPGINGLLGRAAHLYWLLVIREANVT
jgi:hypothetical protein